MSGSALYASVSTPWADTPGGADTLDGHVLSIVPRSTDTSGALTLAGLLARGGRTLNRVGRLGVVSPHRPPRSQDSTSIRRLVHPQGLEP